MHPVEASTKSEDDNVRKEHIYRKHTTQYRITGAKNIRFDYIYATLAPTNSKIQWLPRAHYTLNGLVETKIFPSVEGDPGPT